MSDVTEKLVRDGIPKIIEESGKPPNVRVADESEMPSLLKRKLVEEVDELLDAKTESEMLEEAADVYEVLISMFSGEAIRQAANAKRRDRGSFRVGYVLRMEE